ncbi:MAG: amidohydrolase family protein [Gemmatimonadota bacterium]
MSDHLPSGRRRTRFLARIPRRFLALFTLGLTACVAGDGADPAPELVSGDLVLRNVNVIPMDQEEVLSGQNVVIRGNQILWMGVAAVGEPAPEGIQMVDATGRYLIPGLSEFHAHVGSGAGAAANPRILELYALNGVTTARGMLGHPTHLPLRDSLNQGLVLGPRYITSGPSFSGSTMTPDEARTRVREQAAAGYDLLKIHPGLTRETFDAMAETAHEVGISFSGHVPAEVGLDRALEARYGTIDHLDMVMEALVHPDATEPPASGGFFGLGLVSWVDRDRIPQVVEAVREAGVAMVPTQTLMEFHANDLTGDELAARPEYRYWLPEQVASWQSLKNSLLADPDFPSSAHRAEYIQLRRDILRSFHEGGVLVLLGSDAPQRWNVPGFAAHRELHMYVDAGLSPYEALRTGTLNVASYLGEDGTPGSHDWGSGAIRPGARADLILLEDNPLTDIQNTLAIAGVVVNGRWISGEERERRLAELAF